MSFDTSGKSSETSLTPLHPPGWPRPSGFSNAMMGSGRVICIAGQVGWDPSGTFPAGFVAQSRQTLQNIVDILAQANCGPQHIARMTWFVVDMDEYTSNLSSIGDVYREVIGRHFPAMTLVQVGALVEPDARLEIEATAIAPV